MPRSVALALALVLLGAASAAEGAALEPAPLPALALAPPVTVSGLSSGAFFAHQFHIAFSSLVEGAAILAGGPYACADNVPAVLWANPAATVATATAVCTHVGRRAFGGFGFLLPDGPDADGSERAIEEAARKGTIDDPANIADDRVWLFHGARDAIVPEASMDAVAEVYRSLGVDGERLRVERRGDAAHGFPVTDAASDAADVAACGVTARPYLIDCGFDAAGDLLAQLLGPLEPPVAPVPEHLKRFDQTPFLPAGDDRVSLAAEGFVYVPGACTAAGAACRLHVAFHGCRQGASAVGDDFVADAGYNGWAEANGIVVLYPQVIAATAAFDPAGLHGNPEGCWDWWGYSTRAFATRDAPQMRAVRAMIEALGGR
jgi:poly(3-hydroxybutyrate) depolymerase